MKKLVLIGTMFAVMFTTTGCQKFSYDIEIDKNNNVSISETKAVDMSVYDIFGNRDVAEKQADVILKQIAEQVAKDGYETSLYNEGNYRGVTKRKSAISFTDVNTEDLPIGFKPQSTKAFNVEKGFMKETYSISMLYDFDKALQSLTFDKASARSESERKKIEKASEISPVGKLSIKIPVKPTKHNATNVESKNVYTWVLSYEKPTLVNIEWKKTDYNGLIILLSTVLVLAMMLGIFLKSKNDV